VTALHAIVIIITVITAHSNLHPAHTSLTKNQNFFINGLIYTY